MELLVLLSLLLPSLRQSLQTAEQTYPSRGFIKEVLSLKEGLGWGGPLYFSDYVSEKRNLPHSDDKAHTLIFLFWSYFIYLSKSRERQLRKTHLGKKKTSNRIIKLMTEMPFSYEWMTQHKEECNTHPPLWPCLSHDETRDAKCNGKKPCTQHVNVGAWTSPRPWEPSGCLAPRSFSKTPTPRSQTQCPRQHFSILVFSAFDKN